MKRSFQVALVRCLAAATALVVCEDTTPVRAAESSAAPQFADDFSRGELGPAWRVSFPSFSIVDGVLTARQAEARHSAVGLVKVDGRDLVIEFRFQLDGARSINAVLNDRDFKAGHAGHLCRVSLTPKRIFLGDDKERLRPEIEKLKNDPQRRAEYERLVAGRSTAVSANLETGRWYRMRIDVVGEELSVQLDGRPIARLRSSGIAHPTKTDFYFAVAGESARFDDLTIRRLAP